MNVRQFSNVKGPNSKKEDEIVKKKLQNIVIDFIWFNSLRM